MARKGVRGGTVKRNTTETQIALKLVVDGQGAYEVSTGIRFLRSHAGVVCAARRI